MALIRIDHTPESVKVNLPLHIILPDPGQIKGISIKDRKVLYLLHGLGDDASAWQRYSSIEIYAKKYGLVVVMPSVGRSFYMDQPNGQAYFTYLVEELPQYLMDVFGIVPKRENTMIAGNSMGGYGALKAGLIYPERFFAVASLSGLVSMAVLSLMPDDPRKQEFIHIFGDLSKLPGSEHDPATWLHKAANNLAVMPYLYLSCGKQEDLYPLNVQFNAACRSLGVDVNYLEYDGTHTWPYWDIQIQRFLSKILEPVE